MLPTEKQFEALKYLIIQSADATEIAKKVCFFLIDKSDNFQKNVRLSATPELGFSKEEVRKIHNGVHDMNSSNADTHMNALFALMGSDYGFQYCQGQYDGEKFVSNANSVTIWLKPTSDFINPSEKVDLKKQDLEKVELISTLYK